MENPISFRVFVMLFSVFFFLISFACSFLWSNVNNPFDIFGSIYDWNSFWVVWNVIESRQIIQCFCEDIHMFVGIINHIQKQRMNWITLLDILLICFDFLSSNRISIILMNSLIFELFPLIWNISLSLSRSLPHSFLWIIHGTYATHQKWNSNFVPNSFEIID